MSIKSIKERLINMRQELDECSSITPQELYENCINERLKQTILKYNDELDLDSRFLLQKAAVRVMKAITVMQKNNDVEILKANQETVEENN